MTDALKRGTVEYAEWLSDKLHNTNDYGKEAAHLLVKQATEIKRMRAAIKTFCNENEWAADSWKRQPGIAELFKLAALEKKK